MDVVLLTVGVLLMIAGIAGCILPFVPGPPLSFLALLIQQLQATRPYTSKFLWIWAGVTLVVTLLDYIIPVYGTRKYGGSRYGVWGCIIGLIFGLWFGPLGIIAGPFIGAFIGELIANNNKDRALRAAMGSFIGFIVGTLLKLIACFVMVFYFIKAF
jgi:uncharacterized protein YqgC (DUF456 family)